MLGPWRKMKTVDEIVDVNVIEITLRTENDGETTLSCEPPKSRPQAYGAKRAVIPSCANA